MEERTYATDIAEIAAKLAGHINFTKIEFVAKAPKIPGCNYNHEILVKRAFGCLFYLSEFELESACFLQKDTPLSVRVTTENSIGVYEIS